MNILRSPVELEKNMMKGQKNCKPINFFCISFVYGLEIRG